MDVGERSACPRFSIECMSPIHAMMPSSQSRPSWKRVHGMGGGKVSIYIVPETLTSSVKVFQSLRDEGIEIIRIAERGPLPGQGQVP